MGTAPPMTLNYVSLCGDRPHFCLRGSQDVLLGVTNSKKNIIECNVKDFLLKRT